MDIKEIYEKKESLIGKEIEVSGWIRNHRKQKEFGFIDFSDGTCFKHLQVVYDNTNDNFLDIQKYHIGSAIKVKGILVKSEGKEQINNQAEMYIKQNYTNIHNQIIGNIIYPPRAKKLGIEGSGYLLILIDKEGSIISIKAFDFPNQLLSDAAIKAAKKASKSATHQLSSNVEIKIPVTFKLQ